MRANMAINKQRRWTFPKSFKSRKISFRNSFLKPPKESLKNFCKQKQEKTVLWKELQIG